MLSDANRKRLDSIVMQLDAKGASKEEVQAIVRDFSTKYSEPEDEYTFGEKALTFGASVAPSVALGTKGAAIGAGLGTAVLPGVGTAIGAGLGGLAGGAIGAFGGRFVADELEELLGGEERTAQQTLERAKRDALTDAAFGLGIGAVGLGARMAAPSVKAAVARTPLKKVFAEGSYLRRPFEALGKKIKQAESLKEELALKSKDLADLNIESRTISNSIEEIRNNIARGEVADVAAETAKIEALQSQLNDIGIKIIDTDIAKNSLEEASAKLAGKKAAASQKIEDIKIRDALVKGKVAEAERRIANKFQKYQNSLEKITFGKKAITNAIRAMKERGEDLLSKQYDNKLAQIRLDASKAGADMARQIDSIDNAFTELFENSTAGYMDVVNNFEPKVNELYEIIKKDHGRKKISGKVVSIIENDVEKLDSIVGIDDNILATIEKSRDAFTSSKKDVNALIKLSRTLKSYVSDVRFTNEPEMIRTYEGLIDKVDATLKGIVGDAYDEASQGFRQYIFAKKAFAPVFVDKPSEVASAVGSGIASTPEKIKSILKSRRFSSPKKMRDFILSAKGEENPFEVINASHDKLFSVLESGKRSGIPYLMEASKRAEDAILDVVMNSFEKESVENLLKESSVAYKGLEAGVEGLVGGLKEVAPDIAAKISRLEARELVLKDAEKTLKSLKLRKGKIKSDAIKKLKNVLGATDEDISALVKEETGYKEAIDKLKRDGNNLLVEKRQLASEAKMLESEIAKTKQTKDLKIQDILSGKKTEKLEIKRKIIELQKQVIQEGRTLIDLTGDIAGTQQLLSMYLTADALKTISPAVGAGFSDAARLMMLAKYLPRAANAIDETFGQLYKTIDNIPSGTIRKEVKEQMKRWLLRVEEDSKKMWLQGAKRVGSTTAFEATEE